MNIKQIKIEKLYGYLDKNIKFNSKKNFLIGINGSGKTSILRIIENFIKGNIDFFKKLDFEKIHIVIELKGKFKLTEYSQLTFLIDNSSKNNLVINCEEFTYEYMKSKLFESKSKLDEIKRNKESKPIEDLKLTEELEDINISIKKYEKYLEEGNKIRVNLANVKYTKLLKNYKIINFGSEPYNLENEMTELIKTKVENNEKSLEIFENIMYSVHPILRTKKNLEEIGKKYLEELSLEYQIVKLKEKEKDIDKILNTLASDADIYRNELEEVKSERVKYEQSKKEQQLKNGNLSIIIKKFIDSTNEFFKDCSKALKFNAIKGEFYISILDVNKKEVKTLNSLCLLSSGEQQILCMLVDVYFNIKDNTLIIIDEPEKSMHIEWQSNFMEIVDRLLFFYKNCQIIIATHSVDLINEEKRENLIGLYPYNLEDKE